MLDWKKFADQVPTEPLGVVCGCPEEDGDLSLAVYSFYRDNFGEAWIPAEGGLGIGINHPETPREWRAAAKRNCWDYWAYVTPPEAA